MKRLALVLLTLGFVYAGCDDSSSNSNPGKDTTNPEEDVTTDDGVTPDDTKPEEDKVTPDDVKADETEQDTKDCVTICGDAECGTIDGCECGTCVGNDDCVENMCTCTPACDGKVCGADGCGGVCGECTDGKACSAEGTCETPLDCTARTYDDTVGKVNYLAIGEGGQPGEAMDVDGDPDTCAPADNCTDGLNNQLSGLLASLSSFVNVQEELDKALAGGDVLLLAEFVNATDDGATFTMNFYLGKAVQPVETCDWQTTKCDYYVDASSLDAVTCEPIITFANATLTSGKLVAGGPDDKFSVSIPIQEGVTITVTANMAQINGDVVLDPVSIDNGLIGGAVRKDKIMEAVDMLPQDVKLPVGIDMVKTMLDTFIQPDVDTDADGEVDAASIGIKFKAIAGAIVGLEPAE